MLVRFTRWFLIVSPVVAGILVLFLGTAGAISTTFGIVLIGLGPIIWMWNWFVRMSFEESDGDREPPAERQRGERAPPPEPAQRTPGPSHTRRKLTRAPRKRS